MSLLYNAANGRLLKVQKGINLNKAKDYEIAATPLCLGNISKDWSVDNTKKDKIKQILWDMRYYKLFGFVKQIFNLAMMLFGYNLSSVNLLKCISMNNQECNVRPENVHVNGDELVFFSF